MVTVSVSVVISGIDAADVLMLRFVVEIEHIADKKLEAMTVK